MPTTRTCARCGAPLTGRRRTFCNNDCYLAWQKSRNEVRQYPQCGQEYMVARSNVRRGRMQYCSRQCRTLANKTPNHIVHNGIRYRVGAGGYQSRNPYRLLHRVIWQEHFGPIQRAHDVKHKNGDYTDNRLDNLEMVSRSAGRLAYFADRPTAVCSEQGCDRPARTRGLCTRHYQRLRAQERRGWQVVKGKPLVPGERKNKTLSHQ